jgi:hypothetical protein
MTDPYARLAELAETEAVLIAEGRTDETESLWREREGLVRSLPATPPTVARPHLERAERAVRSLQATLEVRLAEARNELAEISRGRQAAAAYGSRSSTGSLDARG